MASPGLSLDFVRVRIRILSILKFGSGSGFYQAIPGLGFLFRVLIVSISSPGPDFIKHVRIRVRIGILPMPNNLQDDFFP